MMIDLMPFCGTEEFRPYLHKPWSHGDYTYATSGTIIIRVPRRYDIPPLDVKAMPNAFGNESAEKVIQNAKLDERTFTAVPPLALSPDVEEGECPTCDGDGEHDCNCDHCEEGCNDCDGSGKGADNRAVRLRGRVFPWRQLKLALRIGDTVEMSDGDATPAAFRSGDALVLLRAISASAKPPQIIDANDIWNAIKQPAEATP